MRNRLRKPIAIAIPAVAALVAVLAVASVIRGGDLEPPAPPDKGTIQIPPTWHQVLPADDGPLIGTINAFPDPCNSSRFRCVMPTAANPTGEAVLDNETGLVWERTPSTLEARWALIPGFCLISRDGGRFGWRAPKAEELFSLGNLSPGLPIGHPFIGVGVDSSGQFAGGFADFWTITTSSLSDTQARFWTIFDTAGGPEGSPGRAGKSTEKRGWCVRGGQGYDGGHGS